MSAIGTDSLGTRDQLIVEGQSYAFYSLPKAAELAAGYGKGEEIDRRAPVVQTNFTLGHGDIAIAAITSCTNTSNPSVLVAAGLVARKARALGLKPKPWVRTTLSPGSQVVTDYLVRSGLQEDLDALGFTLTGYGCMICIGNSGSLPPEISAAINENGLVTAAILSGNRNFEGRISPDVRAVIAESFERIHRSNLVGMGVLPLQFADGVSRQTLGLTGEERFTIRGIADIRHRQTVTVEGERADGTRFRFETLCRIDTADELGYYLGGGILPYVLRNLAA